jgi:diaminopimelate epimerase
MNFEYTKMQGLGNDFIIIDNRDKNFTPKKLEKIAKRLCTRRISIGADGFMVVENSDLADFKMRFYNADGSIGEMCGNGARCIVRYADINNIARGKVKIETTSGIVEGEVIDNRKVSVKLNNPTLIEKEMSFKYQKQNLSVSYVELGDPPLPHCMIEYKNLQNTSVDDLVDIAKNLRFWEKFPKGANVNFYEIVNGEYILVKTYERGVEGFTLACGTGSASTALVAYIKSQITRDLIRVEVPGGVLDVKVIKDGNTWNLHLVGDTNIISKGIVLDEELRIGDE